MMENKEYKKTKVPELIFQESDALMSKHQYACNIIIQYLMSNGWTVFENCSDNKFSLDSVDLMCYRTGIRPYFISINTRNKNKYPERQGMSKIKLETLVKISKETEYSVHILFLDPVAGDIHGVNIKAVPDATYGVFKQHIYWDLEKIKHIAKMPAEMRKKLRHLE